jgi:hypothetical protein
MCRGQGGPGVLQSVEQQTVKQVCCSSLGKQLHCKMQHQQQAAMRHQVRRRRQLRQQKQRKQQLTAASSVMSCKQLEGWVALVAGGNGCCVLCRQAAQRRQVRMLSGCTSSSTCPRQGRRGVCDGVMVLRCYCGCHGVMVSSSRPHSVAACLTSRQAA